jgi:transposase
MPRAFDLNLERSWRERLQEFERCGLSVREYCRSQAIREHTFFWWRRELARRDRLRRGARANSTKAQRRHSKAKRARGTIPTRELGTRAETAERWRDRLARWRRSGCSISEFCRSEKLTQAAFFNWKKRLAASSRSAPTHSKNGTPAFLPVQVISDSLHSMCMEIRLGDFLLRVPTTIEERSLRQAIRIVREEAAEC